MARRQGGFSDLTDFAAKLPWKMSCGLAVGSLVGLHLIVVTTSAPPIATTSADLGSVIIHQGIHFLAYFFQFIVPAGFLIGATASFIKQSWASSLLQTAKSEPLAIS